MLAQEDDKTARPTAARMARDRFGKSEILACTQSLVSWPTSGHKVGSVPAPGAMAYSTGEGSFRWLTGQREQPVVNPGRLKATAMNLEKIQQEIQNQKLDGWLFFDHHQRDPLAYRVLGLPASPVPTRRWYYMIPAKGDPSGMVHRIERGMLDALPGEKIPYSSWTEQVAGLRQLTKGLGRGAVQDFTRGAI